MSEPRPIDCLVVDDEPLAAALIASYVKKTPFLSLSGTVHSAEDALRHVAAHRPDLVFLDIKMPGMSGMQLARQLPDGIKVVFTTAYSDHAVEGFRVEALYYLLKPVDYDEFLEAAERARRTLLSVETILPDTGNFLTVKSEYRLLRIPLAEIDYIEGLKDYVKIYVDSQPKAVLTLMSVKSLEDALPANFMRIHRSFIVNLDKVRVIERNCIIMGGTAIPVSDSYRKAFFDRIGG